MTDQAFDTSPRRKARIAGALYLVVIVLGLYAELFVRGPIIVAGEAAATARNILAHQGLWRLSVAFDLAAGGAYAAVTVLLYELLAPVNRTLSRIAAVFSLLGIAVGAVSALFQMAALYLIAGPPYLAAFTPAQLAALARLFVRLHGEAGGIGIIFFGVYCLAIGWLIFRSTFMPRIIGVLMALAGAAYLIDSVAGILAPNLDLFAWILAPSFIGEASLTLWLLVVGVDTARWRERAGAGLIPDPAI
jgi:hypothetical protein